ncbi:hypothetical protein BKA65DRAFT_545324 [Rhexocercosporidium sp. MPI-PUGE-AT-0058]|nr:hypothetical protein BKA65DRAFT_545324 [Rhexocercosporidium sp. MPI-PUGE-AT-0058]
MSSQTKLVHSGYSHRRATSTNQGVPMSIFNQQLIEEASKSSAAKDRGSTGTPHELRSSGSRYSRRSHHRVVSVNVTAAVVNPSTSTEFRAQKPTTTTTTITNDQSSYIRPEGPELVSIKQPSCTGLPPTWTSIHDRFIAYLATHAPLDKSGKVQRKEESRERWRNEDIARLVVERFGELDGCIKVCMIENRLLLLDEAGDNDYFKMPYGAYKYERWGRGV